MGLEVEALAAVAAETDPAAGMVPAMEAATGLEGDPALDQAVVCEPVVDQEMKLPVGAPEVTTQETYQPSEMGALRQKLARAPGDTGLQFRGAQVREKVRVAREADRQQEHPAEHLARGTSLALKAAEAELRWPPMRADSGSTKATRPLHRVGAEPSLRERLDKEWH